MTDHPPPLSDDEFVSLLKVGKSGWSEIPQLHGGRLVALGYAVRWLGELGLNRLRYEALGGGKMKLRTCFTGDLTSSNFESARSNLLSKSHIANDAPRHITGRAGLSATRSAGVQSGNFTLKMVNGPEGGR
jgi:hypothetical protein